MRRFVATTTQVVVHRSVEIPGGLLDWMDDSSRGKVAAKTSSFTIFDRFKAVPNIITDYIEYNGHFGPYVYFACEDKHVEQVTQDVLAIIRECNAWWRAWAKRHPEE